VEFLFHTVKSPVHGDNNEVKALVAVSRDIAHGTRQAEGDQVGDDAQERVAMHAPDRHQR
jgi:hypothetical protein